LHQVQHYFPFQIENCIQGYILRNRREIAVVEDVVVVVVAEDNDVDIHPAVAAAAAVAVEVVVVVILRPDRTVISIEQGIRDILTPDLLVRE
jgi:hypothetical protein